MPDPVRILTIRLPRDQADLLDLVAMIEGRSVADLLREIVRQFTAARQADQEFQAAVRAHTAGLIQIAGRKT